jgi:hypothetical protein
MMLQAFFAEIVFELAVGTLPLEAGQRKHTMSKTRNQQADKPSTASMRQLKTTSASRTRKISSIIVSGAKPRIFDSDMLSNRCQIVT